MNKIIGISLGISLLLFYGLPSVHASDDIDWDAMDISYSYDSSDEQLDISITVDESNTPDDSYYAIMKINGETYEKDFSYSSSKDYLYITYSIDIDQEDLEDYYSMYIKVVNDDESSTEYTNTIKTYVDNYLDWSNIDIASEYDDDDEILSTTFTLDDVTTSPNNSYYVKMKLDGSYYTKTLSYSSSKDTLSASFDVDINEDDIEKYYTISYSIIDNTEGTTVYSNTNYKMYTGYSSSSSSSSSYTTSENQTQMYAQRVANLIFTKINSISLENDTKISYLETFISKLEDYADDHDEYEDLINAVITLLEDKIDELESNDDLDIESLFSNSGNTNFGSENNSGTQNGGFGGQQPQGGNNMMNNGNSFQMR